MWVNIHNPTVNKSENKIKNTIYGLEIYMYIKKFSQFLPKNVRIEEFGGKRGH